MAIPLVSPRKAVVHMFLALLVWSALAGSETHAMGLSPFSFLGLPLQTALWPLQKGLPILGAPFGLGAHSSGDVKYRLVYGYPTGQVGNEETGQSLNFTSDLGYPKQTQVFESISRFTLGRFSLRTHYYTPIKGLSSELSRLDWPQLRFGADVDLICTSVFRMGANMDYFPHKPKFVLGDTVIGTTSFELDSPMTAGAHFGFGSAKYTGFAVSMEASWKKSIQKTLDFEEAEVTLGLITRLPAIGITGLRGGYRLTEIQFHKTPFVVDLNSNSAFIEFMYVY